MNFDWYYFLRSQDGKLLKKAGKETPVFAKASKEGCTPITGTQGRSIPESTKRRKKSETPGEART